MAKIKICGLRRMEDIEAVNRLKPDYIGFVFAESARRVTPETAAALRSALSDEIRAVGVFVNEDAEKAAETAALCRLDAVQLHGDEDAAYIEKLRRHLPPGVEIWKAARIRSTEDIIKANTFDADRFVLDAFSKAGYGGTGSVFDWSLLRGAEMTKPFFLAGGISKDNVKIALKRFKPYGVDLSSSVETEGYKDPEKMREIIELIRLEESD